MVGSRKSWWEELMSHRLCQEGLNWWPQQFTFLHETAPHFLGRKSSVLLHSVLLLYTRQLTSSSPREAALLPARALSHPRESLQASVKEAWRLLPPQTQRLKAGDDEALLALTQTWAQTSNGARKAPDDLRCEKFAEALEPPSRFIQPPHSEKRGLRDGKAFKQDSQWGSPQSALRRRQNRVLCSFLLKSGKHQLLCFPKISGPARCGFVPSNFFSLYKSNWNIGGVLRVGAEAQTHTAMHEHTRKKKKLRSRAALYTWKSLSDLLHLNALAPTTHTWQTTS